MVHPAVLSRVRLAAGLIAALLAAASPSRAQSPFDPLPRPLNPPPRELDLPSSPPPPPAAPNQAPIPAPNLDPVPLPGPGPLPSPVAPGRPPMAPFGQAQPPDPKRLSASAAFEPSTLRLMRYGEYRVTIVGGRNIQLPDPLPTPPGLVAELSGRTLGMSIVDGQPTETTTMRFSVTSGRPGTFLMPSFTATVSGIPVTVPAAQLIVQEPGPTDLPYQSAHAVLDLPAGEYYVGQIVSGRLLVFDTPDESVQGISNVAKPTGDFLFQSQPMSRRERVTWEGKTANALSMPIRLTPIKPGESEVSLQAIVFVNKMNAIGRSSGNTAQAMLDTPPVSVRVRPLPEQGRKPGFSGGIGSFELSRPTLSSNEVIVGDPVTLTVTLSGEGNLEAISPPPISEDPAWQSFTPTGDVTRDPSSQRGSKTITYTLVPRSADTRAVPAIPLSVFDPVKGTYVDLTIPPIPIVVKAAPSATPAESAKDVAAAEAEAAAAAAEAARKPPERILTGLAERTGPIRSSASPILWDSFFWIRQILPAGAILGLWLWRRREDYLRAHPEVVRRRAARRAARQHLLRARSAAERRDSDAFVGASIDAIRAAAAPLESTQAESLVLNEVLTNVPADLGIASADSTVRRLFERSHATRFSGHSLETDGVFALLPEVERTVASIEKRQP